MRQVMDPKGYLTDLNALQAHVLHASLYIKDCVCFLKIGSSQESISGFGGLVRVLPYFGTLIRPSIEVQSDADISDIKKAGSPCFGDVSCLFARPGRC